MASYSGLGFNTGTYRYMRLSLNIVFSDIEDAAARFRSLKVPKLQLVRLSPSRQGPPLAFVGITFNLEREHVGRQAPNTLLGWTCLTPGEW